MLVAVLVRSGSCETRISALSTLAILLIIDMFYHYFHYLFNSCSFSTLLYTVVRIP